MADGVAIVVAAVIGGVSGAIAAVLVRHRPRRSSGPPLHHYGPPAPKRGITTTPPAPVTVSELRSLLVPVAENDDPVRRLTQPQQMDSNATVCDRPAAPPPEPAP